MKRMNTRLAAAAMAAMVAAGSLAVPAFAVQRDSASAQAGGSVSAARATREQDGQSMNSVYLLPDSDTYYITEADISWMDDTELMLARNEFYARRGRRFVTRSIQNYFDRQAWYVGTIDPDDFTSEMFNRYEQANVDFIVAYENKRKQIRELKKTEHIPEKTPEDVDPPAEEPVEEYGEIVDIYGDALREVWSVEDVTYAGMNYMISELEEPGELGYGYRDLDGDGTGELLIGPTDPQRYGEGAVFEIYTIEDGIPVEIASSDEDTIYYVCEDNTVRRETIEEDGRWEIDYLDLENGEFIYKDVLVMDENMDTEEPWFMVDGIDGAEDLEPDLSDGEEMLAEVEDPQEELDYKAISFEDASDLRASYYAGDLGLTPFE